MSQGVTDIQRWIDEKPKSRGFCVIGKGKSVHLSRGNDEGLCGKMMISAGSRYVDSTDVLDYNPCRTCWKIMERESAELEKAGNMAAKLKLSEVRGDVRIGSATGSGGVPHAIKETTDKGNVPYCSAKLKNPLRSWGPALEQNPELELCAGCSKHVPTGPVNVSATNIEIPGLGRTVPATVITPVDADTTEEKTEKDAMAAKATMLKEAQDKAAEEIRADIERLASLNGEGKPESVAEMRESIKKAINAINGTGAAAIKAKLRAEADKVEKEAKKAKADKDKADKVASKAVEVKGTQDFTKVEGVPDRITAAAEKVKEVAAQKFARGKEVAEAIFDIRTHILDKDEDPDLAARSDQAKKAAAAVYDAVLAGLPEEGTDDTADIIRGAIGDIKKDVRNAMTDVVVSYVRALDQDTPETLEERKRFAKAIEAHPDLKPSEAIFKHYEDAGKALPTQTRAEIAKANREKKALERKKVEEAVKAGELSEEEAEATLSGGGEEQKTPKEIRAAYIKRMTNSWKKHVKEIKALEDAEEQEEALDELTALLTVLRKEIKG
ncbi:hypothetical protein ACFY1P_19555 [Streptomyces sp. NPDC001407]|uniref:hypothetical protein n=1 Tax=Streptomyces sp. NPDC001407 TaxID=3364573 RepID=UPI003684F454